MNRHKLSEKNKTFLSEIVHFHDTIKYDEDYENWCLVPALLETGDYTGSMIKSSNQRLFWEEFGHLPGVHLVGGVNGYFAIYIDIDTLKDLDNGIAECLKSLSDTGGVALTLTGLAKFDKEQ